MLMIVGNGVSVSGIEDLFGIFFGLLVVVCYVVLMLFNKFICFMGRLEIIII